MTIDRERMKAICESLIFVSDEALHFRKIHAILEGIPAKELRSILNEMIEDWKTREGGIDLIEVAEGYQFRTRRENTEWIKMLVQFKPARLSKAALETLAIVAYNQPATKPDIEDIRGVDCSSSLSQLLEKGLIKILGRKEGPGKPFIYGSTKFFLEVMGLKDLTALPSLREIEESEIIQLEGLEDFEDELEGNEVDQGDNPELQPEENETDPSEEMEQENQAEGTEKSNNDDDQSN